MLFPKDLRGRSFGNYEPLIWNPGWQQSHPRRAKLGDDAGDRQPSQRRANGDEVIDATFSISDTAESTQSNPTGRQPHADRRSPSGLLSCS